jgi:hypothetical protein
MLSLHVIIQHLRVIHTRYKPAAPKRGSSSTGCCEIGDTSYYVRYLQLLRCKTNVAKYQALVLHTQKTLQCETGSVCKLFKGYPPRMTVGETIARAPSGSKQKDSKQAAC